MLVGPYEVEDGGAPRSRSPDGGSRALRARGPDGSAVALELLGGPDARAKLACFERARRRLETLGEAEGFVPVLDAGDSPEGPYLVRPALGGGTLASRLAAGPLPLDAAVELARELALALGRAHALGLVHGDLRPADVAFTIQGRPLIAGLGLREVAHGPRADVAGLGALLHECLTGARASPGGAAPVRRLRPETPRWLERVVERALAASEEERFPDALAFERALREEDAPDARRASLLAALALASVALAALVLAVVLLLRPPPPTQRTPDPSGETPAAKPSDAKPPDARVRGAGHAESIRRARERLQAGDLQGAIDDATRALDEDPRSALAFALRSLALSRRKSPDAALADAERALALDPKLGRALAARGEARIGLKDKAGGIQDLDRALELEPGDAHALSVRGSARAQERDLAGGLADLVRATEMDPKDAGAWHDLGVVRRIRQEWDAAIEAASRAIELDPKRTRSWGNFAHEHHVIHLDLKPDNILVSGFNEVFVIDWGIARVDGEDDSKRLLQIYGGRESDPKKDPTSTLVGHPDTGKSGPVVGTPGYMAPEQFQGEPEKFGRATDVFGLGGILYHALYGTPPCRPNEAATIFDALQATLEPQKPGKLRPGIVPRGERVKKELTDAIAALEAISLKCLERDPGKRYQTVNELVIDVNEWLASTRVLEPDSRVVVG